jgi:hypothetical protein
MTRVFNGFIVPGKKSLVWAFTKTVSGRFTNSSLRDGGSFDMGCSNLSNL